MPRLRRRLTPALSTLLPLALACSGPGVGGPGSSEGTSATTEATTSAGSDGASSTTVATSGDASSGTATATATATTTTTTTSAGDPSGSSCNFICDSDSETGPVDPNECDIWNDACPEGEKCAFTSQGGEWWNATQCVPIDRNPGAPGDPCTYVGDGTSGVDTCDKGTMCWNVDPETKMGHCSALCTGSSEACWEDPASCCADGWSCAQSRSGLLAICIKDCSPLLQDCPNAGEVCYPVSDKFQCAPDVSGEMGAAGDPCEFVNVCDPKTFCGNPTAFPGCDPMAGGCCIPFCDLNAPECPDKTACEPWYDPMETPAGYENVGACVIPE